MHKNKAIKLYDPCPTYDIRETIGPGKYEIVEQEIPICDKCVAGYKKWLEKNKPEDLVGFNKWFRRVGSTRLKQCGCKEKE